MDFVVESTHFYTCFSVFSKLATIFYHHHLLHNNLFDANKMLSYPGTLSGSEIDWGRDYSSLSKVFNTCLDFLYAHHEDKVIGNIEWYQDRFDLYNEVKDYELLIILIKYSFKK